MICSYCHSKGELVKKGNKFYHEDCFDVYRKEQYLENPPFADGLIIEINEDVIREAIKRRFGDLYPIQGHEVCCGETNLKEDLRRGRIKIDSLVPLRSFIYYPPGNNKDTYFEFSSELEEELNNILDSKEVKGFYHFHDLSSLSDSLYITIFGLLANEPKRIHTKIQVAFHQAFMKNLTIAAHQNGIEKSLLKLQDLKEAIRVVNAGYTPEFFEVVTNNKLVKEVKAKTLEELEPKNRLSRYILAYPFLGDFTDVLGKIFIHDTNLSTLKKKYDGLTILTYIISHRFEKDVIRQTFLATKDITKVYRVELI